MPVLGGYFDAWGETMEDNDMDIIASERRKELGPTGLQFSEISGENTESNKQNKTEPKTGNYIMSKQLQKSSRHLWDLLWSRPVLFQPSLLWSLGSYFTFPREKWNCFFPFLWTFPLAQENALDNLITQKNGTEFHLYWLQTVNKFLNLFSGTLLSICGKKERERRGSFSDLGIYPNCDIGEINSGIILVNNVLFQLTSSFSWNYLKLHSSWIFVFSMFFKSCLTKKYISITKIPGSSLSFHDRFFILTL